MLSNSECALSGIFGKLIFSSFSAEVEKGEWLGKSVLGLAVAGAGILWISFAGAWLLGWQEGVPIFDALEFAATVGLFVIPLLAMAAQVWSRWRDSRGIAAVQIS